MNANCVLTPFNYSGAIELANGKNTFKKVIAPFGPIKFRDKLTGKLRTLVFDKNYFQEVIDTFKQGLVHQVPIQLATATNGHNMLPERFRGEIKDLSITDEGLEASVEATDDGAQIIRNNPKLGTSVSILENFERQGVIIPKLLQHVLLTSDPQAVGMSPWREVTLSNEQSYPNITTIDLSEVTVKESNPQPDPNTPQPDPNPNPTPDPNAPAPDPNPAPTPDPNPPAPTSQMPDNYNPTPEEEAIAERVFAEMVAAGELPDPDDDDDENGEEDNPVRPELAAAQLANETRINALEQQLAAQRWAVEAGALIDAGVPPAQINLAADIMSQPTAQVIELSNGTSADPQDIIRKMLNNQKGFVELSRERGNSFDPAKSAEEREKEVLDAWDPTA